MAAHGLVLRLYLYRDKTTWRRVRTLRLQRLCRAAECSLRDPTGAPRSDTWRPAWQLEKCHRRKLVLIVRDNGYCNIYYRVM